MKSQLIDLCALVSLHTSIQSLHKIQPPQAHMNKSIANTQKAVKFQPITTTANMSLRKHRRNQEQESIFPQNNTHFNIKTQNPQKIKQKKYQQRK